MTLVLCVGSILGCLSVGLLLGWIVSLILSKSTKPETSLKLVIGGATVGAVVGLALCSIICNCIVTVAPGYYAEAKSPNGSVAVLNVGSYNFVSPFDKVYKLEATAKALRFFESADDSDIYGAQTKEKDYLTTVCNVSGRPDPERMQEYIQTFGSVAFDDIRIQEILKSQTRRAFEITVNPKTTEEVMSNKSAVMEGSRTKALEYLADFPFVITSLTFEEIRGDADYEAAVVLQANLRMKQATAELQKTVNEKEAAAAMALAEGEKETSRVRAESEAQVKQIAAENAAEVATINAENAAKVATIEAENQNAIKLKQAETERQTQQMAADAEAYAMIEKAKAEAQAIQETGEAYKANSSLMELKFKELQAEVDKTWAEKWSGFVFDTGAGFTFTDLSDTIKALVESGLGAVVPSVE